MFLSRDRRLEEELHCWYYFILFLLSTNPIKRPKPSVYLTILPKVHSLGTISTNQLIYTWTWKCLKLNHMFMLLKEPVTLSIAGMSSSLLVFGIFRDFGDKNIEYHHTYFFISPSKEIIA